MTNPSNTPNDAPVPLEHWASHPEYPASDWQYEVDNGDTRLSYTDWLRAQLEWAQDSPESSLDTPPPAQASAGHWSAHPIYTPEDWQDEVNNGDTRLSYSVWVQNRIEMADE